MAGLSETQQAIAHTDARVSAVFAGAGSGKTRTLEERVRWLIDTSIPPENIIVFTFTRKAAREIRERIDNPLVVCDTFHAICLQWIKDHAGEIGFPYGFNGVINEAEQKECKPVTGRKFDERFSAELQLVGFDQIIQYGNRLLTKSPELVLPEGCHIIVDEAQDNSSDQWQCVNLMADFPGTASLMVVGDFRQSIYEWRSASPEMGEEFCARPGVERYYLSRNYRSGSEIIEMANRLIACGGFSEPMEADESCGEGSVSFIETNDIAASIRARIEELSDEELLGYEDFAVLCRYNQEADEIARYLKSENIPVARPLPIENSDIERFCAYCNFMADQTNAISLCAYLGKTITDAQKRSVANDIAKLGFLDHSFLRDAAGGEIGTLIADSITKTGPSLTKQMIHSAWDVIRGIFGTTTLERYEPVRDKILMKFQGMEFSAVPESLLMDMQEKQVAEDGVAVLTGHAAKGLEWDTVFVAGPCQRKMPGSKKGRRREEERRLLYVMSTRAKQRLAYIILEGDDWSEFLVDEHGRFLI